MYKYTYLLSQSYRTDTSHIAQQYKSNQHYSNYPQNNSINAQINQRVPTFSSSNFKNQAKAIVQENGGQKIGNRYRLEGRDIGNKVGAIKDEKVDNKRQVDFDVKIKQIAEKYSHKGNLVTQHQNEMKRQTYNFQSKPLPIENKSYHEYKSQKNNPSNLCPNKYETANQYQQNKMRQKRLNSLHNQQDIKLPLRQANINRLISSEKQQQNVNRTRIKSQINNYVQGKPNRQQINGMSKKYNYPIAKQNYQMPVKDNVTNYKEGQTVSKLSSLQEKIKSLVGSHIPN